MVITLNKEILFILEQIEKSGFKAYIVGGYVRNYLLGKHSIDVDITTNAQSKELIKIFPNSKIDTNYRSIKFNTKNFNYDITTLREEKYEKDKIVINYIDDIYKDAKRRDFTINAIYMDSRGNIIDPVNGITDIKNKTLKIIGEPEIRFKEDPLRILRIIRFKTEFDFKIEEKEKEAINNCKKLLKKISYYKKKEELNKIFTNQNKLKGLKLIKDYDLEKELELQYDKIKYTEDPLGIWSQINFVNNYPFTKQERNIIESIKKCKNFNNEYLYKNGLYISIIAGEIKQIDNKTVNKLYKNLPIKDKKDIKIKYQKIIDLGYKKNEINDIIKSLEKEILNNSLKNTRLSIIKYLKSRK